MTWNFNIDQWVDKAKGNQKKAAVAIANALFEEVITLQPVVTGNLRRSWFAALNAEPTGKSGGNADPFTQVRLVAQNFQPGDTIRYANFAKYAARVEFGFVGQDKLGRTYNQQGRHTVKTALSRLPAIAPAAVAKVIQP